VPRLFGFVGLLLALALASGCGATSSTTSNTQASTGSLTARQNAFVALYDAFTADVPARKNSLEAGLRLRSSLTGEHANIGAAKRAVSEYLSDAKAWQRAMEALPAINSELAPIRANYARGAAGEVQWVRGYAAVLRAASAGKPYKTLAESSEAQKAKFEAANNEGSDAMNAVIQRLGGLIAFRVRVNTKPLEELTASMRQQAGG
jgi:hypothetical protein